MFHQELVSIAHNYPVAWESFAIGLGNVRLHFNRSHIAFPVVAISTDPRV
jgi:hypothetical protein